MLFRLLFTISAIIPFNSRSIFSARCINPKMAGENFRLIQKKNKLNSRLISVSGFKADLLEIQSHDPKFHVLFIPGNPGIISFYTQFLESLYELLGGTASLTAIGHIAHTNKNWESGRLFSLQEQINHKISFIEQELQNVEVPIILEERQLGSLDGAVCFTLSLVLLFLWETVGHSIGAHISLETFRRSQKKVMYCIGLYPFLAVDPASSTQSFIRKIAASPALCAPISYLGALMGMLPLYISRFLVKKSMGKSWSSYAVDILSTHVLQYHMLRNMLFMTTTEFQTLPENPDWDFVRSKKRQIAFLFGGDDHWGPLHLYEEIRKRVPDACVDVEREGHTHAFSCSEAGSIWVAQHVSSLIKNHIDVKSI